MADRRRPRSEASGSSGDESGSVDVVQDDEQEPRRKRGRPEPTEEEVREQWEKRAQGLCDELLSTGAQRFRRQYMNFREKFRRRFGEYPAVVPHRPGQPCGAAEATQLQPQPRERRRKRRQSCDRSQRSLDSYTRGPRAPWRRERPAASEPPTPAGDAQSVASAVSGISAEVRTFASSMESFLGSADGDAAQAVVSRARPLGRPPPPPGERGGSEAGTEDEEGEEEEEGEQEGSEPDFFSQNRFPVDAGQDELGTLGHEVLMLITGRGAEGQTIEMQVERLLRAHERFRRKCMRENMMVPPPMSRQRAFSLVRSYPTYENTRNEVVETLLVSFREARSRMLQRVPIDDQGNYEVYRCPQETSTMVAIGNALHRVLSTMRPPAAPGGAGRGGRRGGGERPGI